VRQSDSFQGFHSETNSGWKDVNGPDESPFTPTISMNVDGVYVGTAVSSHNAAEICSADFDDLLISPASPPNWVFGNIGLNDPEQLYVALSDGVNTAVVEHPDADAATLTDWEEWNVLLTDFTTVDLDNVQKVYVGFGDRASPSAGGSGAIYVDDIRACPPRCVAEYGKPLYDIAVPYDCVVDEKDLMLVGADWLMRDYVAPPLLGWYKFEGDGTDSSGYGHDANVIGEPNYVVAGQIGQSIQLDGVEDYLIVGSVGISGDFDRTIAGWAKADVPAAQIVDWTNVFGFTSSVAGNGLSFDINRRGGEDFYCIHVYGWEENIIALDQDWHHLAGTYDGTTISWYGDGILVGSAEYLGLNTEDNLQMGKRAHDAGGNWPGQLDDVRVYDKSLTLSEIQSIMDGSLGTITDHHPILSPADVYQNEPQGSQWINFRDYSLIAETYLEEVLWPTP
jgi:hypothetical protein